MPQFQFPTFNQESKPDHLRLDGHCPNCGKLFDFRKTQVLAEEQGVTLMYLKCSQCALAAVATMTMSPQGLMFRGLVTDLTAQDVLKFKDQGSVSSDDIVDLHMHLDSDSLTFS
ncbi:MAG: hypothetical protein WCV85_04340 [Patescibacteria group bacterium]|jgi:hypothetical protein